MSADVLRRAAALMRERAKAATPGPWETYHDHGGRETGDGWGIAGNRHRPDGAERDSLSHIGKAWGWGPAEQNATHIASWHPAVALAVADWLTRCARYDAFNSRALTVARAYLGEQP